MATGWTVRGSNPGGGEIFRNYPNRSWGPPSLLYNGYRMFPGLENGRGVKLTPHPLLVSRSRNRLLSLRAFVACKKGETYLMSLPNSVSKYTYLSSMRDAGRPVQNAVFLSLQLGSNYSTDSFTSLSRAPKNMSASHSYFRTCNLVILSANEVSSKKHYANSYSHFKCLMFVPCIIR
jgi:hypothetical protein